MNSTSARVGTRSLRFTTRPSPEAAPGPWSYLKRCSASCRSAARSGARRVTCSFGGVGRDGDQPEFARITEDRAGQFVREIDVEPDLLPALVDVAKRREIRLHAGDEHAALANRIERARRRRGIARHEGTRGCRQKR